MEVQDLMQRFSETPPPRPPWQSAELLVCSFLISDRGRLVETMLRRAVGMWVGDGACAAAWMSPVQLL
eukprot:1189921-Prorocentrum_minimum.AAC.1